LTSVQQIVESIDTLAPWDLAEAWDHVGLQIGSPNREVQRVLVAVDLNSEVLKEGLKQKVDGFVVHHPLLFKPVFKLDPEVATGYYLSSLIKNDLFLIAAHTNIDNAEYGLNRYLAGSLGLKEGSAIEAVLSEKCKIIVFTPESHLTVIREAMSRAGAGIVGNYSDCSFEIRGNGTFRPNSEARPYLGEVNQFETVAEIRLEMIAEQRNLAKILKAISESHPYEEPAMDIYPLHNSSRHGLGCIGSLDPGIAFEDLCRIVQNKLKAKSLRVLGESRKLINRLAICAGSGHGLLSQVIRQGADAYLTGELNYHDYQTAEGSGLTIIEAGHWTTEHCFIPLITDYLKKVFAGDPDFIVIQAASIEAEPYRTLT
jgi:dinuclear metal center YbgI/SA1388 family protein